MIKKNIETDVVYNLDFDANKTLPEIESSQGAVIVSNLVDAIFNKIFSNW
jgi:hypothetical protein